MEHPINQKVESTGEGLRVDRYVTGLMAGVSRTSVKNAILRELITVNNRPVKPGYALRTGDTVQGRLPEEAQPGDLQPEEMALDILYEDDSLIAVNKPSGLVVHPGAGNRSHTLANALLFHFGRKGLSRVSGADRPGIVHRLDKETSGVILAARKNASHLALSRLFKDREIKKEYRAIVWGEVRAPGCVDQPLARSRNNRTRMILDREGKPALTRFSVKQTNGWLSELRVSPETGRTHQIRVHLASIGHPVVGDTLYGGGQTMLKHMAPLIRSQAAALLKQATRVMLHAERLTFKHPKKKAAMSIVAPLPKDFKKVLSLFKA